MKPVEFPQHNIVWAKDQPEYLPLPAYTDREYTVTCYALTWRERFAVLLRGRLWFSQMNFGAPLQPQRPSVESPFEETAA